MIDMEKAGEGSKEEKTETSGEDAALHWRAASGCWRRDEYEVGLLLLQVGVKGSS